MPKKKNIKTTTKKKISKPLKDKKEFPRIKGILSNTEQALVNKPKRKKKIFKKIKIIGRSIPKVIKKTEDRNVKEEPKPKQKAVSNKQVNKYAELPWGYGDTKIIVLVRDPYWIYTYWEVNNKSIDELKRIIGKEIWNQSNSILRIYDVTDIIFNGTNAHRYFDVTLSGLVNSWYINVDISDRSYCIDIGVLTPDNKFYMYARSNVIRTPRDTISDVCDEEWMISDEEMYKLYLLDKVRIGTSEEIGNWLKRRLKEGVSSIVKKPDKSGKHKKK